MIHIFISNVIMLYICRYIHNFYLINYLFSNKIRKSDKSFCLYSVRKPYSNLYPISLRRSEYIKFKRRQLPIKITDIHSINKILNNSGNLTGSSSPRRKAKYKTLCAMTRIKNNPLEITNNVITELPEGSYIAKFE